MPGVISADLAQAPVRRLGIVDSTMEEARRLIEAGELGPIWIIADEQRAGRGRHGRDWSSPPGNFYATLLLPAPLPVAQLPRVGFAAGVALVEAVLDLAPGLADLRLKWPNDVLLGGAKLAGMLLEGLANGRWIAVGFGVNLASAPDGTAYPVTALRHHGLDVSPDAVLAKLRDRAAARIALLVLSGPDRGFPAIRTAWLAHALSPGTPLRVNVSSERLEGRFAGIDAEGHLLLDTPAGRRSVSAGDVFPLDMTTATPHM